MTVPYTFGTATSSIPLSQLDTNFNTPITLGNTAVYLGNTTTTLNGLTLSNVTISSGNVTITSTTVGNANVTGTLTLSGLTASTALALDASKNVVSVTNTGSGNNVLATSPTLTTPNLGTPSALTLTNATGLPLSTGVTGTLPTTNGGTGLTSFTANGVLYASSSSALATGSALTYSGNLLTSTVPSNASLQQGLSVTNATNADFNVRIANNLTDIQVSSATPLSFSLGANEQMRLTSTGLGIGTSSPTERLQIYKTGANVTAKIVADANFSASLTLNSNSRESYVYNYNGELNIFNSYASGNVLFYTNSAERMRLDSSGNLGIGTSSPATKLHIAATNPTIYVKAASTGYPYAEFSNDGGDFYIGRDNSTNGAFGGGAYANVVWGVGANPTLFATNNTVRMTLDSSGNYGLGVTPSAWGAAWRAQDIGSYSAIANASGNTRIYHNAYTGASIDTYKNTAAAAFYGIAGGAHQWYTAPSGTAGNAITFTQAMTLDASGSLLLGTTTKVSSETLQVYGNFSLYRNGSFTGYIGSGSTLVSGAGASDFAIRSDAAVVFAAGGATERMRLDSSGNLLVGTTSAASGYKMYLAPSGSFNYGIYYKSDANNTNAMDFRNTSNTQVGSIYVTSTATVYAVSSDYRLKNTIAPMTGALAKVAALKPVTYKWNADGSDGEGFIAHELAEVCPHAVTGEKDAVDAEGKPVYQGIDTSFLVATLTAAIQELKAEFDAYKASHP